MKKEITFEALKAMTPKKQRIARGKALFGKFVELGRIAPADAREQYTVTDLVSDLLHYADSQKFDIEAILRMAEGHFEAEKKCRCRGEYCECA